MSGITIICSDRHLAPPLKRYLDGVGSFCWVNTDDTANHIVIREEVILVSKIYVNWSTRVVDRWHRYFMTLKAIRLVQVEKNCG